MEIGPGTQLGQYRIVEQVGRGGMATVYQAYQPSLERYVAIKILPTFYAEDPSFLERFRHEARAVSSLRHPNILTVFDYGEEDGTTFMVSEYLSGGTLAALLGRPLPLKRAAELIRPIANALDYAHGRGMVHRDVKPSNILLDERAQPVLTDFGVARMVSGGTKLTATGAAVGTPEYMAPEQAAGAGARAESDQYALGIVLFEMLTGQTPFQAETPVAVALAHLHKPLPLPRSLNPDLPEAAEAILLKALAKTPDDRYASCGEMADALDRVVASAPSVVATVAPAAPPLQDTVLLRAVTPPSESATAVPNGASAKGATFVAAGAGAAPAPTLVDGPRTPPPAPQSRTSAADGRATHSLPWLALAGGVALLAVVLVAGLGVLADRGPLAFLRPGRTAGERTAAVEPGGRGSAPAKPLQAAAAPAGPAAESAPAKAEAPAPKPTEPAPTPTDAPKPAQAAPTAPAAAAGPAAPAATSPVVAGPRAEAAKPGLARPGAPRVAPPLADEVAALTGRLVAEDNFDNTATGLFSPGAAPGTELAYENGQLVYHFRRVNGEPRASFQVAPAKQPAAFTNGLVDLTATVTSAGESDGWGIQFRFDPATRTAYQVMVQPQRHLLVLLRMENGEPRMLTRVNNDAIVAGPNRLVLFANGPELRAWVNGVPLLATHDQGPVEGKLAIAVGAPLEAGNADVTVAFDHYAVYQPRP